MQRIKKGDLVRLISGDEATKEGLVLKVNLKKNTAIVEGLNIVKKHKKANPQKQEEKGGIVSFEAPIPLCKLALVVPKAPRGVSKIAYKLDKNNNKVRFVKKTQSEIAVGKKK
ncbi:50S ribosomal protein L24 [Candidatus Malacoplasma girerdii]|uniref:Large ribosomal subunit protein uL24 n=1 Tax=Candidatus Malacoplasma girerdii TaxID=1318617 RepID=A0A097SSA9_9BACT|nr:50S ribosomal protein L24 [Candidatus Malacoplasma girerdii]ASJ88991.1 MAG: 50S ribosomal protein L24 [Candidatus Malacoplasma girerdii]